MQYGGLGGSSLEWLMRIESWRLRKLVHGTDLFYQDVLLVLFSVTVLKGFILELGDIRKRRSSIHSQAVGQGGRMNLSKGKNSGTGKS